MLRKDPNIDRKEAVDKYHNELLATMRNKASEMDMTTRRGADYNSWRYKYELPLMSKKSAGAGTGGAAYVGPTRKFKLPYERRAVLAAGAGVTGGARENIFDLINKRVKNIKDFSRRSGGASCGSGITGGVYIPGRKMDPNKIYTRARSGGKAIIQQDRAKPRISSKYNVFVRLMRARLKDNPKFKAMSETAKVSYIADLWNSYKTGAMPELSAEIERAQESESKKISRTLTKTLKTNIKQNVLSKKTSQTAADAKSLLDALSLRKLQTGQPADLLTEANLRRLAGETTTDQELLNEILSQMGSPTRSTRTSRTGRTGSTMTGFTRSEGRPGNIEDDDDYKSYMGDPYEIPIERVSPSNLNDRHIASDELSRIMYDNTRELDDETEYGPVNPVISKETYQPYAEGPIIEEIEEGPGRVSQQEIEDIRNFRREQQQEQVYMPIEDENKVVELYNALQRARNMNEKALILSNSRTARDIVNSDDELISLLKRQRTKSGMIKVFEEYLTTQRPGRQLAIEAPKEKRRPTTEEEAEARRKRKELIQSEAESSYEDESTEGVLNFPEHIKAVFRRYRGDNEKDMIAHIIMRKALNEVNNVFQSEGKNINIVQDYNKMTDEEKDALEFATNYAYHKSEEALSKFNVQDDNKDTAISIINGEPHLEIKLSDNYVDNVPIQEQASTATAEQPINEAFPNIKEETEQEIEQETKQETIPEESVEFIVTKFRDAKGKKQSKYSIKSTDGQIKNYSKRVFDNAKRQARAERLQIIDVLIDPENPEPQKVSFESRAIVRNIPARGKQKKIKSKTKKRSSTPAPKKGTGKKRRH